MLQVARLAPTQLGESRDLVAGFFRDRRNPDGGFQDRTGASDLYYTVFGLDGLIALQEPLPVEATAAYLDRFDATDALDFVHACCLARGYAALERRPETARTERILARVESCRSDDGGYATTPGAPFGSAYGAYLAIGACQDLGRMIPDADRVLASLDGLRAADGGYANHPGTVAGITTATAAAVMVMRQCGMAPPREIGMWLLDRCHPRGGFFAAGATPVPDLLSTATALHALSALHVPLAGVTEPCLDFVDSLWTNRGGFFGTWADDAADCEYTYYALLALGHLSLSPS
jgi:prenyltransferase beta subunit